MFQEFHTDVEKVDQNVAHVVMSNCFIYSRRILQVFYLDVAYTCMLQTYVSSVF
jgi:hypothetical protein